MKARRRLSTVLVLLGLIMILDGCGAKRKKAASPPAPPPKRPSVGVCTWAPGERRRVVDWARHHISLGVDTVYVVDEGRSVGGELEAAGLVASGHAVSRWLEDAAATSAEIKEATGLGIPSGERKLLAFALCLADYGADHDWMAFLDANEYVEIRQRGYEHDLPGFLTQYAQEGGLVLNRRFYGSSGHLRPLAGANVTATFTDCYPISSDQHKDVRTILRPDKAQYLPTEFRAVYRDPEHRSVSTAHEPVASRSTERVRYDRAFIRKYNVRSALEFLEASPDNTLEVLRDFDGGATVNCSHRDAWRDLVWPKR